MDSFDLLLRAFILGVYGSAGFFSLVFALSPSLFMQIEEFLNTEMVSIPVLNPLSRNIDWFNELLVRNNIFVGLSMAGVSVWVAASLYRLSASL